MTETAVPSRKSRSDGERSRAAILDAAVKLTTTEGLEGLSIGRLAEATGMSKSGLYAHFGSKEELQLATVEKAGRIFVDEVVIPTRGQPDGLERLEALLDAFLSYIERRVFPGGCFFESAMAEFDSRPGPVRDVLAWALGGWRDKLRFQIGEAQKRCQIDPDADPHQLTFEIDAFITRANDQFVGGDEQAIDRARRAVKRRLEIARA